MLQKKVKRLSMQTTTRKFPISLFFYVFCCLFLTACTARTPVTPGTIPEQQDVLPNDEAYGKQVLNELSKTYPVSNSERLNRRARSIVLRLADAANAGTQPWYVYVLKDDSMLNAAATRGNHVFVWTGLMKLVDSDDELAAVLGHEIGHVLANHTMPTPMEGINDVLVATAGVAANSALGSASMGIGGQLATMLAQAMLVNPGSQRLELEADHIGLFLMARAGYNPRASISLWKKMSEQSRSPSGSALAFLSTHPPNEERIQELEKLMPQALRERDAARRPADSFNRNQSVRKRPEPDTFNFKPDTYRPKPGTEVWRVAEDFTSVFSRPDDRSRIRAHIYHGGEVVVRGRTGPWVEIEHPIRGFVRGRDLSPPG